MFDSLFNRAQAGIHNAINHMLGKVVALVPFAIAFGFAIAALSGWLNRELGPEVGNSIMAVIFAVIGLAIYAYSTVEGPESLTAGEQIPETTPITSPMPEPEQSSMTSSEKEVLTAMLGTVAPAAAGPLARMLLRNLPLVMTVLAAFFVMTRATATDDTAPGSVHPEPAE